MDPLPLLRTSLPFPPPGIGRLVAVFKEERLRLGLTLTEVAERAGIDKANLSRMENDQAANPTLETLQRYAEALGREVRVHLAKLPKGRRAG